MTYRERQRLADIQVAIDAIRSHLRRGDLSDGLVSDAVRIRLLEIGEAVKMLPAEMLDSQPDIPWRQIARTPPPASPVPPVRDDRQAGLRTPRQHRRHLRRITGAERRQVSPPGTGQCSFLMVKKDPRMVPASFDLCRANLNREASSSGISIPSDSLNPTARFPASSMVYITLIDRPLW